MMRVVILQHRLLHYRLELFNRLRDILSTHNIELVLVHGQASETEKSRKDEGELGWAIKVKNLFGRIRGKDLLWQPFPKEAKGASLVIVMQENRILSNYSFLIKRLFGGQLVAYWGHGKNFQSAAPTGLRERWKSLLLNRVDWWFAYTDISVDYVAKHGFPPDKITNLENAIDVSGFQQELASVTDEELKKIRKELSLPEHARVGLFCGSLYPEKRIDLIIESYDQIRSAVPDFHSLIIGDGPSAGEIRAAAATRPWIHCVGVQKGRAKAILFRLAHVQLNPGAVGLHVLDAFSAGLPMITIAPALHGPEIAYLRNEVNGIIMPTDDAEAYAKAVIRLLTDEAYRCALQERCLADAQRYTVENMVHNFTEGILRCLESHGLCPALADNKTATSQQLS